MSAVAGLLRHVAGILDNAGVENAYSEARWLIESGPDEAEAERLAGRRAAGEPLQYVTGRAGFRRLSLSVGPGVFIPRPETELVAGRAMELLPRGGTVVDVGTGSGAIALSIVDERPDARVLATERSEVALAWAAENRAALSLPVVLVPGDLYEGLPFALARAVDVVVSNPPYVALDEAESLPRDVIGHEPHDALFAGERGLEIIERIAAEAPEWLRPGGSIVVEIGCSQASEVRHLLRASGFAAVEVDVDLAGRPRIASARMPS